MRRRLALGLALTFLAACTHRGPAPPPRRPSAGASERGLASWYGKPYHGRRTASGEIYDMDRLTAAHRTLPFGTVVRVTRRDTGASVTVRINDRGPFIRDRIIDLSHEAARRIGLDTAGLAPVTVEVVGHRPAEVSLPSPTPPPPAQADCRWVQVGAFADARNAERARDRLLAAGEKAVVIEGPHGTSRVRVGPFASEEEAEQVRLRLLPDWPPAQVVGCGK